LITSGSVIKVEGGMVTLRSEWAKGVRTGLVYPAPYSITVPVTECDLYR
jgi:hypothetical protein